jgi:fructokinase
MLPEVVCLGEALVDLVSVRPGARLEDAPAFRFAAGGAPANVAAGVARLGRRAALIAAVGDDAPGRFVRARLARAGVDVRTVTTAAGHATALALVAVGRAGTPEFVFYGDPPAHLALRLTARARARVAAAPIFHYGSIGLAANPSRAATLAARAAARRAGRLISYDPNLRLALWPSVEMARRWLRAGLRGADVVKVNRQELAFLTGIRDVRGGLDALCARGARLAVVTLGAAGCAWRGVMGRGRVPGVRARVVDTTGAGDAFVAAMLVGLLEHGADRERLPPAPAIDAIVTFATGAAAASTERRGGIPALPSRRRARALLGGGGQRVSSGALPAAPGRPRRPSVVRREKPRRSRRRGAGRRG